MTTFDLTTRPEALIGDTTASAGTRREIVWQPLRGFLSLKAGDNLTATVEAPAWARSVIAMQTTPNASCGFLSLEVGGSNVGGMGTALPDHPAGPSWGGSRTVRGVIVSDSVRLNLSLGAGAPSALEVRLVFLDH
jgi:hypothetical protein